MVINDLVLVFSSPNLDSSVHNRRPRRGRQHHLGLDACLSSGLGSGNDIIIIINVIIVIVIILAIILENGSRYNDPKGRRQQQLRRGSSLQAAIPPHQASIWRWWLMTNDDPSDDPSDWRSIMMMTKTMLWVTRILFRNGTNSSLTHCYSCWGPQWW